MSATLVPATPNPTARSAGARPSPTAAPVTGRELAGDLAADHHPHHVVAIGVGAGHLAGVAAVLEHGDAIGDGEHLVHAVADEHDGAPLLAQPPHGGEQLLHLVFAQSRRRLVEHQDARRSGHRLGDLDELALGERETAHGEPRVERHPEETEQLGGAGAQGAPVDQPEPTRLAADQDVRRDVHLREQRQLLRHTGDAELLGAVRCQGAELLAAHLDAADVGGDHAGEDLDERRLAGAVLAEQGEHLAGADREVHAGEGVGGPESLRHAAQARRERRAWVGRIGNGRHVGRNVSRTAPG